MDARRHFLRFAASLSAHTHGHGAAPCITQSCRPAPAVPRLPLASRAHLLVGRLGELLHVLFRPPLKSLTVCALAFFIAACLTLRIFSRHVSLCFLTCLTISCRASFMRAAPAP